MFVVFLSYKDSTELIDNFENSLKKLLSEQPYIRDIVNKLDTQVSHMNTLVSDCMRNNINFDR